MAAEAERTLEYTPTWAVAAAASMFVVVSLLLERGIHFLSATLKRKNQKPLRQAVHKMVEELMLLGFISLFLTVFQSPVSKICIPKSAADHWLPCELPKEPAAAAPDPETSTTGVSHSRKLLHFLGGQFARRRLLSSAVSTCGEKGKVPFVSLEGLHQLHIFIFVLAIVHVAYSCLNVILGFTKMHAWKEWEAQTRQNNYNPLTGLRETFLQKSQPCLQTHSVRGQSALVLLRCFFGQFVGSVSKSDYLTFRLAFISNHHLTNKFNFHDYVMRSMEADFKVVVGISWWLWAFVVIFLLLNVYDWNTYFWMSFIPLILVLIVGTKQQHIISILATEAQNDALGSQSISASKKSTQAVTIKTRDELFWFNYPGLLLLLIHFILFQNAFELAVFFWLWATFGWHTCFFERRGLIFTRVFVGVVTQVLCSYSTLPLYALVNQMGSDYKPTIFKKSVHSALHGWHGKARQKQKERAKPAEGSVPDFLNPLGWVANETKQVELPSSGQPAPQAREEGEPQQEEPIPQSPAPAAHQPEVSVAHEAAREKFIRLYGKVGGAAKVVKALRPPASPSNTTNGEN